MALSKLLTIENFSNPFEVFEKHDNNDGYEKYFDDILAKSQKEFLINILGYQMYKTMQDAYPDSGFFSELVSGVEYTEDSILYDFEGIKDALMRYTYYIWQRFNADSLQSSGSIRQGFNESVKVIPDDKMVSAYNEMEDLINNDTIYAPTIYHYIDTQYTGTDWEYKGFEKINKVGI